MAVYVHVAWACLSCCSSLRGYLWRGVETLENQDLDLLAQLHALPETDPVDVDGGAMSGTCACTGLLTLLNTVCVGVSCA